MNHLSRRTLSALFALTAAAALVSSCATTGSRPASGPSHAALPLMERVALGANACWFKSGDPAFSGYKLAPELNSFSGRPRILLVKAHSPESRPLLVVEAEGSPARMDAYGPVMTGPLGPRVSADVNRWASGGKGC